MAATPRPRPPLKLRISELAARTGRSVHTIRWYEQQGLLPPVPRLSGQRIYSNRHVEWMELMDRLRTSGMPIAELRRYTALAQRGGATLEQTRAVLLAHRERVQAQKLIDAKIGFYTRWMEEGQRPGREHSHVTQIDEARRGLADVGAGRVKDAWTALATIKRRGSVGKEGQKGR